MKQLFTMFMICVLLIVSSFSAFAALIETQPSISIEPITPSLTYENLTYSIKDGEVTISQCKIYASGELTIPDTLDGYPVTKIAGFAFSNCSNLTKINLPKGLKSIGSSAFSNCYQLNELILPEGLTYLGSGAFSDCKKLTEFAVPDGVTVIGGSAFSGCSSLTEVRLPSNLTEIGDNAFSGCDSLTGISIPKSVTAIGENVFLECTGLTRIDVDAENQNYSSIDGVLYDRPKTIILQYPQGKTDTICTLPDSVTEIGKSAFSSCSHLKTIRIPEGVETIGNGAFSGCSALTDITIPDGVTTIGSSAFYQCVSLRELVLPKGLTRIEDALFFQCSKLTDIVIPDGVTVIGNKAFYSCQNLKTVTIPRSVIGIGTPVFTNNYELEKIYFYGTQAEWDALNIGSFSSILVLVKHTETSVSEDETAYTVTPVNIDEGSAVILALYRNKKLAEVQVKPYTGEPVPFTTGETGVTAKVMVWESLSNLKEISRVENVR